MSINLPIPDCIKRQIWVQHFPYSPRIWGLPFDNYACVAGVEACCCGMSSFSLNEYWHARTGSREYMIPLYWTRTEEVENCLSQLELDATKCINWKLSARRVVWLACRSACQNSVCRIRAQRRSCQICLGTCNRDWYDWLDNQVYEIVNHINNNMPVLVNLDLGKGKGHTVVIAGYLYEGNTVLLFGYDPNTPYKWTRRNPQSLSWIDPLGDIAKPVLRYDFSRHTAYLYSVGKYCYVDTPIPASTFSSHLSCAKTLSSP